MALVEVPLEQIIPIPSQAPTPTMRIRFAIAREEGFWQHGSRAHRNNNPGNLEFKSWQSDLGAVLETGVSKPRFACFPTAEEGFAALIRLCGFPKYAGKSLRNLIASWAPPNENNTSEYLENVCNWTGLTPDSIIDQYL